MEVTKVPYKSFFSIFDDFVDDFFNDFKTQNRGFTKLDYPDFSFIGYDDFDSIIKLIDASSVSGYPVKNHLIYKNGTNEFQFAVTGFSKEDIDVKIENNYLIVSAKNTKEEDDSVKYVIRKISQKSFEHKIKLSYKMDVDKIESSLKNGILSIKVPLKKDFEHVSKQIKIS